MIELKPSLKALVYPMLLCGLVACRASMPIQEISTAKQEVNRAKLFNSEKYAKVEFNDSKTSLLLAHESAFSSKPDFKKAFLLSQNSTTKAREASKKSVPNYVKDLQKEAETALESASSSLAESLASDLFEQAKLLKVDGDAIVKNADAKFEALDKEDSAGKETIFTEYEKGIQRYNESIVIAEKAKDLSLAQTQAIVDSSADIESNLDLVEKYSKDNETMESKISTLREEYKSSIETMESGSLRDGFHRVEKVRLSTNELMSSIILPYAKERIKLATVKIDDADKFLASNKENKKSSVAGDNLSASKEAFSSSVDLLAKERYYDSIQQSDESIRLAEEIVKTEIASNPVLDKDEDFYLKKRANEEKSDELEKEEDSELSESKETKSKKKISPSKPKWKKHIVKKRVPPETLWRIAADKKYLGDRNRWREIYNANKKTISNPNKIYPNQVILVPVK